MHVNALLLGHLRGRVHDERLIHRWASDTVLPLTNHALSTAPNSELGNLSPTELKFGTTDYHRFNLPLPLVPGNNYCDLVQEVDHNLATVRAITTAFQQYLRTRHPRNQITNLYQPGDLILWNPREQVNSFRSSKLAPKLLGLYSVISQERNDIICTHCHLKTQHTFHSDRVSPFLGAPTDAAKLGIFDKEEYVVSADLQHHGNLNRLKTVEVIVSWLGYGAESNTWERWKAMRNVSALHTYLQWQNLAKFIPLAYR